jgi:ABC-type nickel/cobalt efflux system permease component RcnA
METLLVLAHAARQIDTVHLALATGLIAGIAHTFIGVDHLAALMPISVNRKLKAAWLGVRWGVGHSVGVIIVAVILLAFRETLASDLLFVEEWGERLVGAMLILLGLWGIRAAMRHKLHVHAHSHDGDEHSHLHVHADDAHDPADRSRWHAHVHKHAALGAGALHGLAGVAHLLGVVPALAAPTLAVSFAYLGGFAIGSIVSMAAFAGGFGEVTSRLGDRSPGLLKGSMYFASVACLVIGVAWILLPLLGIELGHHH